jgi:hypothetical protein
MSDIVPISNSLSRFESRRFGKTLSVLEGNHQVALVQTEAKAREQAAKVDAVALVAERALTDIALLSQKEQQLAELVPLSTSRLQAINDLAVLAIADVVSDTARQLR